MESPIKKLHRMAIALGSDIEKLANVVLDDPRFPLWTASAHPNVHHYGQGGLAQHTMEVAQLALQSNSYYINTPKFINPKLVYLAALFHDVGKLHDYAPVSSTDSADAYAKWYSTSHKQKIYHITTSAIEWSKAVDAYPTVISKDEHAEVLHAILAHHGRPEWKSPVTPQTKLAWLLHLSDCLSARIDDVDKPKL